MSFHSTIAPNTASRRPMHRVYKPELVVVIDTEMDGSDPLTANLLSIGLVAVRVNVDEKTDLNDAVVTTFYCTLSRDPTKPSDTRNYDAFWSKHPWAWQEVNTGTITPPQAMHAVSDFLYTLAESYRIKFVAKPACVDWMFFKSYYERFGPRGKYFIGHRCLCLDSMNLTYKLLTGHDIKLLRQDQSGEYNHHALCDAKCQAMEYLELRRKIGAIMRQSKMFKQQT